MSKCIWEMVQLALSCDACLRFSTYRAGGEKTPAKCHELREQARKDGWKLGESKGDADLCNLCRQMPRKERECLQP